MSGLGFNYPGDDTRYNDAYVTWLAHFDAAGSIDYSAKQNGPIISSNVAFPASTGIGGGAGEASAQFPANAYAYSPVNVENSFNLYSGDFTIDWWEYAQGAQDVYRPSFTWDTLGIVYSPMLVGWGDATGTYFYASNDQANWNLAASMPMGGRLFDTWCHRALVRKGPTFYAFRNGILQGTQAVGGNGIFSNATYGPMVGCWPNPGGYAYFYGHIDEFRVSNGIARWTANFSVPSAGSPLVLYKPDPDLNTKLLMHFDNLGDASQYKRGAATAAGGAVTTNITPTPFGGSRGLYLNGTNSYITYPDHADWSIGDDYTIDMWIWIQAWPPAGQAACLATHWAGDGWLLMLLSDGNMTMLQRQAAAGGDYSVYAAAPGLTINTWHHIAFVRAGRINKIYVDGVGGPPLTTPVLPVVSSLLYVGMLAGTSYPFNGYIDELRITKDRALWTANFTPPNAPYKYGADPVVLLLHFDADIRDNSQYRRIFPTPTAGVMGTSAVQSKFGGRSALFDGTCYIAYYPSADWTLDGYDWTIDFWVFQSARQAADGVVAAHHQSNNTYNDRWSMRINPAGLLRFDVVVGSVNKVAYPTATPIPLNAWTHCAVVCRNNSITFYINGVSDGTTPITDKVIPSTGGYFYVGAYYDGANKFVGYIDEFRVNKGRALWTANFTPPTQPGS